MKRQLTLVAKAEAAVLLQALAVIAGSAVLLTAYLHYAVDSFPVALIIQRRHTNVTTTVTKGLPSLLQGSPTPTLSLPSSIYFASAPQDNRERKRSEQEPTVAKPTRSNERQSKLVSGHNAAATVQQARVLFEQGKYQAALTLCNQALKMEPGNSAAAELRMRISKAIEILKE